MDRNGKHGDGETSFVIEYMMQKEERREKKKLGENHGLPFHRPWSSLFVFESVPSAHRAVPARTVCPAMCWCTERIDNIIENRGSMLRAVDDYVIFVAI